MKKLFISVAVLGLLSSVSVAQRGHAVGGVAPMARTTPNAITLSHGGVAPNARTAGSVTTVPPKATTVAPNARTKVAPNARTVTPEPVAPNARTVAPDAQQ